FGDVGEKHEATAPDDARPDLATSAGLTYVLVDEEAKFTEFLQKLRQQKRFAFDTETDDLGAMRSGIIGMSFSWSHGTGYYVPVNGPEGCTYLPLQRVLTDVKPILEDPAIAKVGHNIKYDLLVMKQL